ncbi:ankyrin repeat domain-containing protein [Candidatus Dependentiae bacterium]|nr:ankyrin repeat domain-containing protein [Candidatus Dependentiae bacterium]
MYKKLFYLMIFLVTSNLFCMECERTKENPVLLSEKLAPDLQKDIAERILTSFPVQRKFFLPGYQDKEKLSNVVVKNFKQYIYLKRLSKVLNKYLDEIVDQNNQITRYQQWMFNKLTDYDFEELNGYLLDKVAGYIKIWNPVTEQAQDQLYLLTEFLIYQKKLNPEIKDKYYESNLLMNAARAKLSKVVATLLKHKIFDVNAKSKDEYTALMEAIYGGNKEIVKALIIAGANVNSKSKFNQTPLIIAAGALRSDSEIVEILLNAGAKLSINEKDNEGHTALILASGLYHGEKKTVELLVAAGANINEKDKKGRTALAAARNSRNEEIVDYLISKGATE